MHDRRLGWAFGAGTFAREPALGAYCPTLVARLLGGTWASVVACEVRPPWHTLVDG